MKILTVFGTRPEAVKLAPVIKELEKHSGDFTSVVCVTAQHREMLDQILNLFNIDPDYDLNIMRENQTLFDITANVLQGIRLVIEKENPGMVLVQGDTTSTFAGSLAAYYARVQVGHVEAGLRTHDKYQPFPEEINRRLTSQIADIHFAPTKMAKENLLREGFNGKNIFITGNTVIDALMMVVKKQSIPHVREKWNSFFSPYNLKLDDNKERLILVTGHRRENFGKAFENICNALKDIASTNPDVVLVYPVHLNPNVQEPVKRILNGVKNICLMPPLSYEPFVYLMSKSYLILTDSGGVQEEAPSLGKPVLVMRETTERPEGVDAGTAKLVGTDRDCITDNVSRLLTDEDAYASMAHAINPYGDGMASKRIFDALKVVQNMRN